MGVLKSTLGYVACGLLLMPFGAEARPLTIATVGSPTISCVFNKSCNVTTTDTWGVFKVFGDGGMGRLQTRTFVGTAGAPAAGLTAYVYRVDMTATTALGTANCVKQLVLDVGPVVASKYGPSGVPADVFVIATGGMGTLGVTTATQTGSRITFTFGKQICPAFLSPTHGTPGQSSFFFGFASKTGPVAAKARIVSPSDETTSDTRVPQH